jgi:hypothetical protein
MEKPDRIEYKSKEGNFFLPGTPGCNYKIYFILNET